MTASPKGRLPVPRIVFVLVAVLAVSLAGLAWLRHQLPPRTEPGAERFVGGAASASGELPRLWSVPKFSYVDQSGARFTQARLAGRVWIADFIFTTCTNACPMMTARMVLLQRKLTDPSLGFVSFSVDPKHDTPPVLSAYRKRWQADGRWVLLQTDSTLGAFTQGMRVTAQRQNDPKNPILHSSTFFLIDRKGGVRGVYDSNDDKELDRLAADAQRLSKSPAAPAAHPSKPDGAQLYAALGCGGCHEQPRIAPPLGGLAGSKVKLENGSSVDANEQYVLSSIVTPGAQQVAGYLPLMPSYSKHLSAPEIDALVHYVMTLPATDASALQRGAGTGHPQASAAPSASSAPVPATAVDPVCGMKVRVTPDTPHATHDGHQVYFCSERCRDEYLKRM